MRDEFAKHFDVVVVVWVLALALGWSLVMLSRSHLSNNQWTGDTQNHPAWVISDNDGR
jgi:hypothetical protein